MANQNKDKRPQSRGRILGVRMSELERSTWDALAARQGVAPSTMARLLMLDVMVGERALPKSVELVSATSKSFGPKSYALKADIKRVGVNINQIARKLNSGEVIDNSSMDEFIQQVSEAKELFAELMASLGDVTAEAAVTS